MWNLRNDIVMAESLQHTGRFFDRLKTWLAHTKLSAHFNGHFDIGAVSWDLYWFQFLKFLVW